MADKYSSFAELKAGETYGKDYQIVVEDRGSAVAVIAPHGGTIEPTTLPLTRAIAGDTYSLYGFEGLIPGRPHGDLHITSELFDEPKGRALVRASEFAVAIHGRRDRDDPEATWVGGLDDALVKLVTSALADAGFRTRVGGGHLEGRARGNICNDGKRGAGVQLELPKSLRDDLRDHPAQLALFARAVQKAVLQHLAAIGLKG